MYCFLRSFIQYDIIFSKYYSINKLFIDCKISKKWYNCESIINLKRFFVLEGDMVEKTLLSSKTISTAGTLFFNAVIDLWVVQIFGSARILGNTMAFTTLAAAICSFIGGYLADSSFRLRVLIMINAASSLVCGIAFLEQKQLIGKPLTVYLLVFLLNIGSYLSSPLFKTITSISVEKTRIVAFNRSITFASQLCTVLIPPAATWLFAKKIIGL